MTSINIYYEKDLDEVLHLKCKCGHELSKHAFTFHHDSYTNPEYSNYVRVSQCILCPIDIENRKFTCDLFRMKN